MFRPPRIVDLNVVFDRWLLDDRSIDTFVALLRTFAPKWSSKLVIRSGPGEDQMRIPPDLETIAPYVLQTATQRGIHYGRLADRMRREGVETRYDRVLGMAEMVGAGKRIVGVIEIDSWPAAYVGGALKLRNRLTLQITSGDSIEGRPFATWIDALFGSICAELRPAWGSVSERAEWDEKVMSHAGGGIAAVGYDLARWLPGLFAHNYFGPRYVELIGRDRLLAPPAAALPTGEGLRVVVAPNPIDWSERSAREHNRAILAQLGPAHFFDQRRPDEPGIAPDWADLNPR